MTRWVYKIKSDGPIKPIRYKGFTFREDFIFARMGNILLATSTWMCRGCMYVYASSDNGKTWEGGWVGKYALERWNRHLNTDVFDPRQYDEDYE